MPKIEFNKLEKKLTQNIRRKIFSSKTKKINLLKTWMNFKIKTLI